MIKTETCVDALHGRTYYSEAQLCTAYPAGAPYLICLFVKARNDQPRKGLIGKCVELNLIFENVSRGFTSDPIFYIITSFINISFINNIYFGEKYIIIS